MTSIVLMGLGVGCGVVLIFRGLRPATLTLQAALELLNGTNANESDGASVGVFADGTRGAKRLAGRMLDANIANIPRLAEIVVPDLAITGTPPENFAMKVVGYGLVMAVLAPLLILGVGTAGIHTGVEVPLLFALLFGVGGAAMPFYDLHSAAKKRRRHFLHSLSTYTAMVGMAMAGSMGWSNALEVASSVSTSDWAMDEIAQALLWSQVHRQSPAVGLERLATRFALPDLLDLARSMSQAGDGARIRDTLETKSASLRQAETTEMENDAQATTQRMMLPGMLVLMGYLALIFYPFLSKFTGSHL